MINAPVDFFCCWLSTPGKACLHILLIQVFTEEIHSRQTIFPVMEKESVLSLNPKMVRAFFFKPIKC